MTQALERTGVVRPRLRGSMHAIATGLGLIAGTALTLRAGDHAERAAAIAYTVTMTAMFGVSAAYHLGRWSAAARRRMKALDHTAIFCFIFGSYLPLAVLVLGPRGRAVFIGSLAAVALTGIIVKLLLLDRLGGPGDLFYAVVTWWGVFIAIAVVHVLSPIDLALAVGGLLLYSLSAGLLVFRWWDPAPAIFGYHEVAHTVMLLGTIAHYVLYWRGYG
ncbi:MAG: hemolysin III family protein [Actinomycetota bacterium]|nr:hemolysin III family protein [Actinomycetota bacterium]